MILHEIEEILLNAIMVTGLVVVMMMLIECFNVWSKGRLSSGISHSGPLQVIIGALLGAVPGCMGGFAVVSMYTHGLMSMGALIAMMIASSGDEAFVMLAMIPRESMLIFLGLTILAIVVGLIVDRIHLSKGHSHCCTEHFSVHEEDSIHEKRRFGWKRLLIIIGVTAFLAALCFGLLEHEHEGAEAEFVLGGINLLSEDWMNVMFAILSLSVLVMAVTASDHFVDEHLWHHVIREHLPKIFLWTTGALIVINLILGNLDITQWISRNGFLLVVLAAAIGFIPESGPHMLFVTMFASGLVPLPVLIASCISQDGHAALPLLAESKKSFIIAKSVNFIIAILIGGAMMLACNGTADEWSDGSSWYESTKEFNEEYPDVFYLVSTNIAKEEGSLIALNTPEEKAVLAREMNHIENKVFADSLNFFAPYYHQHTMEALSLCETEYKELADGIAYEVYDSFRYYMKHLNGGRPVVLAGFSQGAMLAKELMKRMTPKEYSHVAAAYILGWGLSGEDIADARVNPAECADDTGVCISFNSVSDTSSIWNAVMNGAVCSINPINWQTDPTPASFEYRGQTLTACLDTVSMALVVNGFEEPELAFTPVWPSGCLHFYEIQFYNTSLNKNALQRCRAFEN